MSTILDLVVNQLGGDTLKQVSKQVGADEGTVSKAISAAVPALVGALARNASKPEGAQSLFNALERDHDGGILDNVSGFLGSPGAAGGAGILRHVLGNQRGGVETGLAKATGLNAGATGTLLEIVAPMVLGALGRTQRQQSLDANGLSQMLGGQANAMQSAMPDVMGMVTGLLDSNKDGNVLDDIGNIAGKLFGKR